MHSQVSLPASYGCQRVSYGCQRVSSLLQIGDWGVVNAQNMTGIMQMVHDSHGEYVAKKVRRAHLRCSLVVTEQDGEHCFLPRLMLSFIHLLRKPFRFKLTIKLAIMAYSPPHCPPFYSRVWTKISFTNDMSGNPYVCVRWCQTLCVGHTQARRRWLSH